MKKPQRILLEKQPDGTWKSAKQPKTTDLEKTVQMYNDAILRVVREFTNKHDRDSFIHGLTESQYAALRDLNVIRIDFGDTREP